MTLLEAIRTAVVAEKPIELSPTDAERVLSALDWGERMLESIGDGETEGGHSYTSGLQETFEGAREPATPPTDPNLPSVYTTEHVERGEFKFWVVQGPAGLGSMPLFENEYRARVIANALNSAYGLGHAFGRGADK